MWNVSCSRVFIGQRELSLWLYTTLCVGLSVWHACVFVCARRAGGGHKLQWERKNKKEIESKRALGAPCPVLAWFLCGPRGHRSAIFSTPHSFSSLWVKHMHAHAGLLCHAWHISSRDSAEYSAIFQRRGFVLSGCHKHFPSLPTYRGGESVQLYPLAAGSLVS